MTVHGRFTGKRSKLCRKELGKEPSVTLHGQEACTSYGRLGVHRTARLGLSTAEYGTFEASRLCQLYTWVLGTAHWIAQGLPHSSTSPASAPQNGV